jgi:DNA repair photolyase
MNQIKYKVIYEPKGKAKEYSDLAVNLYNGCSHGCTYCYAPGVIKRNRDDFTNNVTARKDVISKLIEDCIKYKEIGDNREVLLSFTSDPYQSAELDMNLTQKAAMLFNKYGVKYKILTKNELIMRDRYLLSLKNCKIGMTIIFDNDGKRLQYEPGASTIEERITVLKYFHDEGFYTWVSMEPVIDPDEALRLIPRISFVDMIKVGKLNYVKNDVDWTLFYYNVIKVLKLAGVNYYIKEDLRKYA